MSNEIRKAAKRARIAARNAGLPQLARPAKRQKTPTPLVLRSFVQANVLRKAGDALPKDAIVRVATPGIPTPRSAIRVMQFLGSGGSTRGSAITGAAGRKAAEA